MKDLGRAEDEKRSPFRVEKERVREEEGGRKELMSLTLSFTHFLSHNKSAMPLSLSDISPSLITFVTVNHL